MHLHKINFLTAVTNWSHEPATLSKGAGSQDYGHIVLSCPCTLTNEKGSVRDCFRVTKISMHYNIHQNEIDNDVTIYVLSVKIIKIKNLGHPYTNLSNNHIYFHYSCFFSSAAREF